MKNTKNEKMNSLFKVFQKLNLKKKYVHIFNQKPYSIRIMLPEENRYKYLFIMQLSDYKAMTFKCIYSYGHCDIFGECYNVDNIRIFYFENMSELVQKIFEDLPENLKTALTFNLNVLNEDNDIK